MGWDSDGTSEHEEWFEGGRPTVYKESVDGVGGFPFLLSLLVLFYSKASYDFGIASTLVLSWSLRNESRTSCLVFRYHICVTNITYARPRPLQHVPDLTVVVYLARLSGLIESRVSRHVGVWSAFNFKPCNMLTDPWEVEVTVVSSPSLIMMGDGSLLNDMKQLLSRHILYEAPKSTTHTWNAVVDDVPAAWVASIDIQKRSQVLAVVQCSSRDAVTSTWDSFISDYVSLILFHLITLFRGSNLSRLSCYR